MSLIKQLQLIKNLIESSRGKGSTLLLRTGTDSFEKRFAVFHASPQGCIEIMSHNGSAVPFLIDRPEIARGLPIAVDVSALEKIVDSCQEEITELNLQLSYRDEIIDKSVKVINDYQEASHALEEAAIDLMSCKWYEFRKMMKYERALREVLVKIAENKGSNSTVDKLDQIAELSKKINK